MTDFDPNATPECDQRQRHITSEISPTMRVELHFVDLETGQKLERRARIAEEQLRVAKEFIVQNAEMHSETRVASLLAMQLIKQVGQ